MQTVLKNKYKTYGNRFRKKHMKTSIFSVGLILLQIHTCLVADALKDTLTNLLDEKNSVDMVSLDNLSITGKSGSRVHFKKRSANTVIATVKGHKIRKKEADTFLKEVTKGKVNDFDRLSEKQRRQVIKELVKIYELKHRKSRPPTAVVATVNGVDISKKEADSFLSRVTAGKVKDFDKLDKKQQKLLITDLAKPIIVKQEAYKQLTKKEKEGVLRQVWLEKQKSSIEVSSDEMLALYEEKKTQSLAINLNAVIPPYLSIGKQLKNEIIEKKITQKLMKDVEIEILDDHNQSKSTRHTPAIQESSSVKKEK